MANYCDTCGHQYSDVCGGCETLDGVPVKYSEKKKTNADVIRAMTDEELASFIERVKFCVCYGVARVGGVAGLEEHWDKDGIIKEELEWLKQVVEE